MRMKSESFYKGIGYMLLSATGMSLVGLFGKLGLADFTVSALIFWRFLASFLLFFLALLATGRLEGIFDFEAVKIQVLRAFFVLSAQYCFFYYLEQNTLLNASALLNTGPIFISLIDWAILRHKVGRSSWIGCVVAFVGAIFILRPDAGIFSLVSLVGLLSGVSQGASQVVFGLAAHEKRPYIGVLHLFALCSLLSLFPFLFFHTEMVEGKQFAGFDLLWIFCIGVGSISNQLFRADAYRYSTPSRLSPFLYFTVLLAGIWDWVFFGKTPDFFSILGTVLVVLGGLIKIYLRKIILEKEK